MNAHGFKKGISTCSTPGTASPTPIPSITRRGEWSMGKVLDVYWHFSETGDRCLGRTLAGVDPKVVSFGNLHHYKLSNPIQNEDIAAAMDFYTVPFWTNTQELIMILLSCCYDVLHALSIIHTLYDLRWLGTHAIVLQKKFTLHEKALLDRLLPLVIIETTEGVIENATGIPPHIDLATQMRKIL